MTRFVLGLVVFLSCVLSVCGGGWADAPMAVPVAALFRDGLPGEDVALLNAVKNTLADSGYVVRELTGNELCDPAVLLPSSIHLLVLPQAAALPVAMAEPLETFLKGGGDLIALGAPLWQSPLVATANGWFTQEELARNSAVTQPEHVICDFKIGSIDAWQRGRYADEGDVLYETVSDGPGAGIGALHVRLNDLHGWDNLGPVAFASPFPEGHTLTVFTAKGDADTPSFSVEWDEEDGSRWIAVVPLSTEWRRYVLTPEQFHYWESVPGRAKTVFDPQHAVSFHIGLACSHGATRGKHEYWVGPFGSARCTAEYEPLLQTCAIPAFDILSPGYKYFSSTGVVAVRTLPDQVFLPELGFDVPTAVFSSHPRAGGAGFNKGRPWRFIPLLEAVNGAGEWRGNPGALYIHTDSPFKGGQWAAFGIQDVGWYRSASFQRALNALIRTMRLGVYFVDGGADHYTYFEDQEVGLGARITNMGFYPETGLGVRVTVADGEAKVPVFSKEWLLECPVGESRSVQQMWRPESWSKAGYTVTVQLLRDTVVIDQLSHEIHVWRPKTTKSFITANQGEFILDGQRWRVHGVNYMPSSGIASEDNVYFEHWLSAASYDPAVIQRDLGHLVDLKFNTVSIFLYHDDLKAQNLLDVLRRFEEAGIKVNLSLRPGTPIDFEWDKIREMIEYNRLSENDTVFAYDLAWEPLWLRQTDRKRFDRDWEAWLVERYGSVENAERDWQYAVPRGADGIITNPAREQVETDGPWRVMTAAYRRFLDTLLYKYYGEARALVRGIDPYHFVSFRMTEAGDPTMRWDGIMAYDFPYLAAAVDLFEPEAYGRIGDWEKIKPGWFEHEYARWADPSKPFMWAEAGVSAWDTGVMAATPKLLDFQGHYLRDFYRLVISSCADGVIWWWYPGGFRWGENSDYGIINPDGSDRPATKAIRENVRALLDGPSVAAVTNWITIDRDAKADGIAGAYDAVCAEFWDAIQVGQTPGLRTAGTGTNSANCPLLAVGNTPCNGTNPPKYLDGYFDSVEVEMDSHWVSVGRGGVISLPLHTRVHMRAVVTNLGETSWLSTGKGVVYLTARVGEKVKIIGLPADTPHLGTVTFDLPALEVPDEAGNCSVTLSFDVQDRTPFGEKYSFVIKRTE